MTDGTTLGGRYEIGDVLGRGGMAEVHAGRDVRLGRQVAVKMLRVDLARDPSFQARFRREAQSAASLNHPAVVAVYDTGEDVVDGNSVPYIVMEYVDGTTLRELLNSGRRLLPERALEITAGVLDALDYSHRHGIVHRDIKPANIMLTRTGAVKVMDFGIARSVADESQTMTQTSAVVGTAQYLSPEQARGETVDARSDLYSTGCLLYELLTGRPPFVGDSPVSVAYQHVREQPQAPSTINADVPHAADAIVLKSLAKSRDERYQTASEMRADIDRALAGRPVQAPAVAAATQAMAPVQAAPATTALPVTSYDREEPKRRTTAYVLLALATIAVLVLGFLALRSAFDDGPAQVTVPNVVGLSQADATAALTKAGLKADPIEQTESQDIPAGRVISQDPKRRASVDEGTSVALEVSAGAGKTRVPTLTGLSLDDAIKALSDAGLELGDRVLKDSTEAANQVLSSDPEQGQTIDRGKSVNLVVSSGKTKVPDVIGKDDVTARSTLEQAGFKVDARERATDDADPGTVVKTDPDAGKELAQGSTVTIYVATAPEPTNTPTPETSNTPPFTPPATTPPPAGGGETPPPAQ